MSYAKPSAARLIDQRARRRATQALIDKHRDEFRALYEQHRHAATDEAQTLVERAAEVHPTTEPPRLMTGARKPGQSAVDRIDVARCPHCVKHHDRGHVCTKCGAVPQVAAVLPDDGEIDEVAVERAMRGEPVALTERERREAFVRLADRGVADRQIAARLNVSDRTVLRWRQGSGVESRWMA